MPTKYPGGYQIIDLGGKVFDGMEIPGIYDKIKNSDKPVILTFSGKDTLGDDPNYFINCHWISVSYTNDGIQYSLCFGNMYVDIDGGGNPEIEKGIMVSASDRICFYEA